MSELEYDRRPWGEYQVLADEDTFKVKRITVLPGERLSLQLHHRRAEHWFVVHGTGEVTLGERAVGVAPGVAVDVPLGCAHRIHNTGTEPLVFVEVQHGSYFGEDDIVRLSDDYGRGDQAAP